MRRKLTDQTVKHLAAPDGKKYLEVWDEGFHTFGASFGIRVSPTTGSKTWILLYHRSKRLVLGRYPSMKLKAARTEANRVAAEILANNRDPLGERKTAKAAHTFEEVAERFLVQWPKVSKRAPLKASTVAEYGRVIRKELIPRWGDRKATEVTRADVVALLDEIRVERNAPIHSNRVRALVGCLFKWAVSRGLVDSSPATALGDRMEEHVRRRTLSPDEIKILWGELDSEAEPVRSFYRWLLVCGQRVGESRLAKWENIKGGVWHLPAEDTKARRAHKVPLAPLALENLDDLRPVTGKGKFIFETPSSRGTGAIRWHHRATERIRDRAGIPHWTAHDLRRTCGTALRDLKVAPDVVARILNHADSVAVPGSTPIYMQTDRWPEQIEAMQLWGAQLERIVSESDETQEAVA